MRVTLVSLRLLFCCLLLAAPFAYTQAKPAPLNNDAVIKMAKAGLSDNLIVEAITTQPGSFSTSATDLIALKQAGISDRVLATMLGKSTGGTTAASTAATSTLPPGVDEIGVYYKNHAGTWTAFAPEIVNFKSGGFMKSLATDGIIKPDRNGHLPGKASATALVKPVEILIYVPDGTAPEEYQLLKMRVNSNNREFRSMTGGVFHSSTGGQRDNVPFTPVKIAPRLYTFTLDSSFGNAEYGILPPGTQSTANAVNEGKIYSFHIAE